MKEDMKKFIPNLDEDKLEFVYNVKKDYNAGLISLKDAQAKLRERVTSLTAQEIAYIEQKLQMYTDDECEKEDIQAMMEIFDGLINISKPNLPDNHPIMCYYREIDKMEELLKAIEDLVQYPVIKNQWYEIYDKMKNWKTHLSRKQNQLYSLLEKKGFDRPTTTMWTLDDYIRDEISMARELLETDEDKFIEFQSTLVADIRDLMSKEAEILYPTSLVMINEQEFEDMKIGDKEIGFFLIDVEEDKNSDTKVQNSENPDSFKDELQALMKKHGYIAGNPSGEFDVATGKLTLEQINLIYKHMPVDLSYVDENEIVKFYSDTKHRIFPRSKNVIGRDVKNCHPRNSVHVVEEIIEKFRKGEQSFAEFWINKPDLFIYISYTAVRDENGNFKGILEMMQDCTHIRALEGSRTLLTWGEENNNSSEETKKEEKIENKTEQKENKMDIKDIVINQDTKMTQLFDAYKGLKDKMEEVHPNFKMLKTPLAKVLLANATIKDASERTGMSVDDLIAKIKEVISKL